MVLDRFRQYLLSLKPATVKTTMTYTKQYNHLLATWYFSEKMEFTVDKRKHIMKSLALLSNHIGCYDTWQTIRIDIN